MSMYDDQIAFWTQTRREAQQKYDDLLNRASQFPPNVLQFLIKQHQSEITEAEHYIEVMQEAKLRSGS